MKAYLYLFVLIFVLWDLQALGSGSNLLDLLGQRELGIRVCFGSGPVRCSHVSKQLTEELRQKKGSLTDPQIIERLRELHDELQVPIGELLHLAIDIKASVKVLQYLEARGADLNYYSLKSLSRIHPLIRAILQGNQVAIDFLISAPQVKLDDEQKRENIEMLQRTVSPTFLTR